jgi:hypothetical protein
MPCKGDLKPTAFCNSNNCTNANSSANKITRTAYLFLERFQTIIVKSPLNPHLGEQFRERLELSSQRQTFVL